MSSVPSLGHLELVDRPQPYTQRRRSRRTGRIGDLRTVMTREINISHMNKIIRSQEAVLLMIGGAFMNIIWGAVLSMSFTVVAFALIFICAIGLYVEARREEHHW